MEGHWARVQSDNALPPAISRQEPEPAYASSPARCTMHRSVTRENVFSQLRNSPVIYPAEPHVWNGSELLANSGVSNPASCSSSGGPLPYYQTFTKHSGAEIICNQGPTSSSSLAHREIVIGNKTQVPPPSQERPYQLFVHSQTDLPGAPISNQLPDDNLLKMLTNHAAKTAAPPWKSILNILEFRGC
jgi:hypothetical protein